MTSGDGIGGDEIGGDGVGGVGVGGVGVGGDGVGGDGIGGDGIGGGEIGGDGVGGVGVGGDGVGGDGVGGDGIGGDGIGGGEIGGDGIGVVGLGVMGSAIARRLLAAGHPVRVYDVRPAAVEELTAAGAAPASKPADLAGCPVVLLSLNTAAIVEEAVFGPGGVLSGAGRPLLADMSSIDPASTRDLAGRAAEAGAGWVDAPLSGGAPAAQRGELTLMLGGTDADVRRAGPVLGVLASRITHLGPAGSGQLGKLVNQVLVGCGFAALAEAAALVRAAGLPAGAVLGALTGGRADSALLQEFFTKFAAVDLTPTGRVSNMVKDLETAREYAVASNVPLPLTSTAAELHRWLVGRQHGGSDNAALMLYYVGGAER